MTLGQRLKNEAETKISQSSQSFDLRAKDVEERFITNLRRMGIPIAEEHARRYG